MYVPSQHSTHHPNVVLQFETLHSFSDLHRTSVLVNSNKTRSHRDNNGSLNAMNIENRFQNKYLQYIGADKKNIMDFSMQYDVMSRDFHLSHHEERQNVHYLFHGEAFRYICAEVLMFSPHNKVIVCSISKQQCIKANLSWLSFEDMVDKSDGNRRMALSDKVAYVKLRITVCPRDWLLCNTLDMPCWRVLFLILK